MRKLSSFFLSFLSCSSCAFEIRFFEKQISNDLEWDGESKRIIAVGDGKEKLDVSYEISSKFR